MSPKKAMDKNFQYRKRSFTLLEIIITIVVISMASTAVGIKINTLISRHRFESSCKRILNKISYAKQMALTNQCDVFLTFSQDKKNLLVTTNFASNYLEKPPAKENFSHLSAELENKHETTSGSFVIECFSTGYLLPKGTIRIFSKDGREKTINLEEFSSKDKNL